jgi:hypothetical protein
MGALAWSSVAGCAPGSSIEPGDAAVVCQSGAIIAGEAAPDPALDAIGTLGGIDEQGRYRPFCSATLVAPTVALTAKHCTMRSNGASLLDDGPLFFAVGADADSPLAIVGVLGVERSSPDLGGVAQMGSDVAVVDLVRSVDGVTPLTPTTDPLTEAMVGAELTIYGFGTNASGCSMDVPYRAVRRVGSEVLRALRGNVFDLIYGGYAAYLEAAPSDRVASDLVTRYQSGNLLDSYEIWAARAPGGPQACHGDSGGPVIRQRAGQLDLVGVVSWSWQSATELCDYGSVFAVFGPETAAMLATHLARR